MLFDLETKSPPNPVSPSAIIDPARKYC
jgi:hypothetical protein